MSLVEVLYVLCLVTAISPIAFIGGLRNKVTFFRLLLIISGFAVVLPLYVVAVLFHNFEMEWVNHFMAAMAVIQAMAQVGQLFSDKNSRIPEGFVRRMTKGPRKGQVLRAGFHLIMSPFEEAGELQSAQATDSLQISGQSLDGMPITVNVTLTGEQNGEKAGSWHDGLRGSTAAVEQMLTLLPSPVIRDNGSRLVKSEIDQEMSHAGFAVRWTESSVEVEVRGGLR